MASRKIAPVGSLTWISDERETAQHLEEQDVEIIAYAVRNDMEWLNEHMANIFERNIFDMAEIMKTPGRLRGKIPRTIPKPIVVDDRNPPTDIFTDVKTMKTTTLVHRFQEAIVSSPNKQSTPPPPVQPQFVPPNLPRSQSETRSTPARSPTKSSPPEQLNSKKVDNLITSPFKETTIRSPPPRQPPAPAEPPLPVPNFTDSGFFTSSNPNSQADNSRDRTSRSRDSTASQVDVDVETNRQLRLSESGEGIVSRNSFSTAREDASLHPPSSPVDEVALLQSGSPDKGEKEEMPEILQDMPVKKLSPAPKVNPAPQETRRSGRLALRASQSASQSSPVPEVVMPSSPPKSTDETIMVASTEDTPAYPPLPVLAPEILEERQESVPGEPSQPLEPQVGDSFGATGGSELHSEPPTPEAPLVRKSSMNFSSLPSREPLTNKKNSLGAKVTRESHLDQVKQSRPQRASWMNKKGNGKSLGASSWPIIRKNEDGEKEVEAPQPKTGEKRKSEAGSSRWRKMSRGEDVGVIAQETVKIPTKGGDDDSDAELRRHNKTSTQRLHDKISQLGKHNRNARSFPASVPQPNHAYPDLSVHDQGPTPALSTAKTPTEPSAPQPKPVDVDIGSVTSKPDEGSAEKAPKPQLARSKTDGGGEINRQEPVRRTSPRRPSPIKTQTQPTPLPISSRACFERTGPAVSSPGGRSAMSPPSSPLKTVSYASINDVPQFAAAGRTSPRKTVATDHILSAAKAHRDTLATKAREIWARTATSASAKAETICSPPLRKWQGAESLQDIFKRGAVPNRVPDPPESPREHQELYPDLGSVLSSANVGNMKEKEAVALATSPVVEPLREGRQTRNSRSRAESAATDASAAPPTIPETAVQSKPISSGRQTRNSKPKEEVRGEVSPSKATPLIGLKAIAKQRDEDEELQAKIERKRRLEEILRMEKQMLERLKQRQLEDNEKPKEPSHDLSDDEELEPTQPESNRSRLNSAEPERPPSRLQERGGGGGGLRFQKIEPKRIVKQTKDQPLAKPGPVSIKIGTASQREMQDQRNKTINAGGPTGTALVSALKSSFEPSLPTMNPSTVPRGHALRTSSSNGSVRSAVSSANSTKQLRSLQSAASQRKKEQEDRERKAAQKRDLERRRADNQRKQEEEQKKMRQKHNTTPGPVATKPVARVQPYGSLRGNSQEPEANKKPYGSLNKAPYGSIKRVFPHEPEEPQSRHVPGRPGTAASYHQEGPKKRRTNDFEERSYEMPPPIRASVQKKELVTKTLAHGYTQTASSSTSTVKASSSKVPQVEGVKFSKEKIKFAGEVLVPPPSSTFKTPGTSRTVKKNKTPVAFKESPLYPNGESIILPEIPTDSEDEDDYSSKKPEFPLPQWAESPELRELLRKQQTIDPTEVFGPMARLDMEAIFQTDKKQGRFRARTSSANWGGADRLTQSEILADQEARRKMMETGKWTLPGL